MTEETLSPQARRAVSTVPVMRGESGSSLRAVQARFEPVLSAAGQDASTIGQQLFELTDALGSSGSLRAVLTDPSLPAEAKAGVADRVLVSADERTRAVVRDLVAQRWAKVQDLGHAVEHLGLSALLASAEARGALATVEDELFRMTRILSAERGLRAVLSDDRWPVDGRVGLVDEIFGGKVDATTLDLAHRATTNLTHRKFVPNLLSYSNAAAERRRRLVATVTSAVELTEQQRERLAQILGRAYGHPVHLNTSVDPLVVGGLRVQVGPDVIDSTMISRLTRLERALAS